MNPLTQQESKPLYNITPVQQETIPSKDDYQMVLVQDSNTQYQHQQQILPLSMQQNYQFHNFVPLEVRAGAYAFEHKPVIRSSSFSGYENYPTQYTNDRGFQFRTASNNNYIPQNPHPSFSGSSATSTNNNNTTTSPGVSNIMNTVTSQNPTTLLHQSSNINSPMSYSSPLENTATSRDGSNTPTSPNPQIKPPCNKPSKIE